jgi:peptidyl-prolyl cis-trans isomerase A (cyclophilin A)
MGFTRFVASVATLCALSSVHVLSQTPPKSTAPAKSTTPAKPAASTYDRTLLKPALLKEKAPDTFQVKFETTRGDFTVTVTRAWAPIGADRFYNLVKHHYFDGARFFRVLPNFVAQFGINANPPVNAAWSKATIKDDPVTQRNKRGTLTYAKTTEPNSRSTQIFINLKDNPSLDSQGFAAFGVVDGKGINVVEMMYDQYGDSAGMDQTAMEQGGEKYIASKWPKLDTIKEATIIGGTSSTPAAKPAVKSTSKPVAKPPAAAPKP